MAKAQKNFYLPREMIDWLDCLERETGVTPTRLAIAAFAQLAGVDVKDREFWIRVAVEIDRGDWTFPTPEHRDDPGAILLQRLLIWCQSSKSLKGSKFEGEVKRRHREAVDRLGPK